jgi:hypothetical protein
MDKLSHIFFFVVPRLSLVVMLARSQASWMLQVISVFFFHYNDISHACSAFMRPSAPVPMSELDWLGVVI